MGDTYSAIEIRSTIRTFREYLRDLIETKFDQFGTKLRLFVNFCERDDVVRVLARELHTRTGDVREWFAASTAEGAARPLPKDAVGRLAHQYKVLLEMKQQRIDARALLSSLFAGPSMNDSFQHFREAWLEGLRVSFDRVFGRIERDLEGKERVELDGLVARALSEEAPAAPAPKPAAPPAAEPKPVAKPAKGAKGAAKAAAAVAGLDVDGLVKLLEKTVKGAKELAVKAKKDVETDVKILKLELSKHAPSMDVVRAVAAPLERAGGKIAEVAAALRERAK
jgi:hypothetical protein